jgi:hypothetical protein
MQGCDMIGRAITGTGKTLAFGISFKIKSFNSMLNMGLFLHFLLVSYFSMRCNSTCFLMMFL